MPANPWLVPVLTLRRSIGSRREESRSGRIGELKVADSVMSGDSPVDAQVILDSVDGGIEVTAVLDAPWHGECRRCLRPLSGQLHCRVREMYRPRQPGEKPDADADTYPLSGDQLDLQPLIRDALLLELPIAPLCRDDCLGLCPECGADLNLGPCGCPPAPGDPRWAVLGTLREEAPSQEEAAPSADPRDAGEGRKA